MRSGKVKFSWSSYWRRELMSCGCAHASTAGAWMSVHKSEVLHDARRRGTCSAMHNQRRMGCLVCVPCPSRSQHCGSATDKSKAPHATPHPEKTSRHQMGALATPCETRTTGPTLESTTKGRGMGMLDRPTTSGWAYLRSKEQPHRTTQAQAMIPK